MCFPKKQHFQNNFKRSIYICLKIMKLIFALFSKWPQSISLSKLFLNFVIILPDKHQRVIIFRLVQKHRFLCVIVDILSRYVLSKLSVALNNYSTLLQID